METAGWETQMMTIFFVSEEIKAKTWVAYCTSTTRLVRIIWKTQTFHFFPEVIRWKYVEGSGLGVPQASDRGSGHFAERFRVQGHLLERHESLQHDGGTKPSHKMEAHVEMSSSWMCVWDKLASEWARDEDLIEERKMHEQHGHERFREVRSG